MSLLDDPRWGKVSDHIERLINGRLEIISTMVLSSEKEVAKHNHLVGEVAALREIKDLPYNLVVETRRKQKLRVVGE